MNPRQAQTFDLIKNTLDHEAKQTDAEGMKEFLNAIADEAIDRLEEIEKAKSRRPNPTEQ